MDVPIYRWKETSPELRERILRRSGSDIESFLDAARAIVEETRTQGDAALIAQAKRYDGADISQLGVAVSRAEVDRAVNALDPKVRNAVDLAFTNIETFHKHQMPPRLETIEIAPGLFGGEQITPIESVALYIPRGTAAYPSVLLMLGIPARVAGVGRICVVSPPSSDGSIDGATLYAAHRLGITEIYRMGGAGAIAALAYGTESVKPVLKAIGPGNIYATAAKRLVADRLDPGAPAGPSELIVLADGSADPELVATDVLIEAEHGPYSASLLVTNSEKLGKAVAQRIPELVAQLPKKQQEYIERVLSNYGGVAITDTLDEAIALTNDYAPEHLEVLTENPWELLPKLKNAGEIMLGPWTPTSICNYALGVNAILPTGGRAKTASVVTVFDFLKRTSISYATKEGFDSLAQAVADFADFEGFPAHAAAVRLRMKEAVGN